MDNKRYALFIARDVSLLAAISALTPRLASVRADLTRMSVRFSASDSGIEAVDGGRYIKKCGCAHSGTRGVGRVGAQPEPS